MANYPAGVPFDFVRTVLQLQKRIATLENGRNGIQLPDGSTTADGVQITNPIVQTTTAGDEASGQLVYSSQVDPLNTNGDFEDANGIEPWGSLGGGILSLASTGALHGLLSLQMTPDGVSVNPSIVSELCAVTGSLPYSISLWTFSTTGFATVQVGISWYDSSAQFISSSLSSTFALTAGVGILKVVTATSPSNAAYGQIRAQLTGTPGSGVNFSIDTAWIVEGTIAPALALASSITGSTGADQYGASFPAGAFLQIGDILGNILAAGSVDATKVSFTAAGIGGITTSVQATAPVGPHAGDLWFDTSNGNQLKQWNGATWVLFQYGTQAIAAASITASLIAAATITAAQIAAGTILGSNIAAGTLTADLIQASAIVSGLIDVNALNGMTINGVVINSGTINATDLLISGNDGGVFVYGTGGTIVTTLVPGQSWTAPPGVTVVQAEEWAPGGGGAGSNNTGGGGGGGGGEYVQEPTAAVTPGNTYTPTWGAAGAAGSATNPGGDGGNLVLALDAVTLTAHGGKGGHSSSAGGLGGTGSTNTIHNDGGAGGSESSSLHGMGGGSSGTPTGPGRSVGTDSRWGVGAPGDGGSGGDGGNSTTPTAGVGPPLPPGGGGGGGGTNGTTNKAGAAGGKARIRLTYTSSTISQICALAGSVGTDPLAGQTVGPGLNLFNQLGSPSAVPGAALLYGLGGHEKYVGTDGIQYNTGRSTVVITANQTINSASNIVVGANSVPMSWAVGIGTYLIDGMINWTQGATTQAQNNGFSGPAISSARMANNWWVATLFATNGPNTRETSSLGAQTTPAFANGVVVEWHFRGVFTATAAGTFSVIATAPTPANTYVIGANSWASLSPVT